MRRSFNTKRYVNCLTLPASDWIFETSLSRRLPAVKFFFQGVERTPLIHREAWSAALSARLANATLCMTEEPSTVRSFLGHSDRQWKMPFSLVYLDWMGTWSLDKMEQIHRLFLRRAFADTSFLVMTLSLHRGRHECFKRMARYVEPGAVEAVNRLPMSDRTRRALTTITGPLKIQGVAGFVKQEADYYGYAIEPLRVHVYDNALSAETNVYSSEISLMFKVRRRDC